MLIGEGLTRHLLDWSIHSTGRWKESGGLGGSTGRGEAEREFKDWTFWKILQVQSFMKCVMVCNCSQSIDDVGYVQYKPEMWAGWFNFFVSSGTDYKIFMFIF